MAIQTFITHRFVKSEDLNHHGTLYAGRTAEWFVESGLTAAANLTKPENIVCLEIHGMLFKFPVRKGEIVRFESKIVFSTRTRLIAYIRMISQERVTVDGFITFVHVDASGRPLPHGIEVVAENQEDLHLVEIARELANRHDDFSTQVG